PDPWSETLQAVATRGRIGAMVTQQAVTPDLSRVTVEVSLWVRDGAGRWAPLGSRTAVVRPDDLGPDAGREIAEDPRIQGTFRLADLVGLGAITPQLKSRVLRVGAATQQALEAARSAFQLDLDTLALPVLEPDRNGATPGAAKA